MLANNENTQSVSTTLILRPSTAFSRFVCLFNWVNHGKKSILLQGHPSSNTVTDLSVED